MPGGTVERLEEHGAKALWLELAELLQRGGTVRIERAREDGAGGGADGFYAIWEPPIPMPPIGAWANRSDWAVHRIYMKARRRELVGTGPVA